MRLFEENSREMKRLWLAGTIAAGLCAHGVAGDRVVQRSVELADLILEELKCLP